MASPLSLPSQPLNDFSSSLSICGSIPSETVPASTHLDRKPSNVNSYQNGMSSVSTTPNDQVPMGSHYHHSVETLEKKPPASEGRRPRIRIKFRLQNNNKTDVAVANIAEKTLISGNCEKSTKDPISENGSTKLSKLMEGETLVAVDGSSPPVQKINKRLFSTFSVSLNKDEIKDDLIAMYGPKRIKKAKKRPKNAQKLLDGLFPGLLVKYISLDDYKVHDHET